MHVSRVLEETLRNLHCEMLVGQNYFHQQQCARLHPH